jgi:hypothetical protein
MTTAPVPLGRGVKLPHRHHFFFLGLVVLAVTGTWALVAAGDPQTTSVVQGSGTTVWQGRVLPPFTSLELAGATDVTIHLGTAQHVTVRADSNLLANVTTQVRGGGLVVDTVGSFRTTNPMSVDVTVPSLDGVTLSGTGNVAVYDVHAATFAVALSGSGRVTASGSVDRLGVTVAGAGDASLTGIAASDVGALVTGTGTIEVDASRTLAARISGAGTIFYSGSPASVTKSITGHGVIVER